MFSHGDNIGPSDFSNENFLLVGSSQINMIGSFVHLHQKESGVIPTPAVIQAFKFSL